MKNLESISKEEMFDETNYKFIYQGDGTSLITFKDKPFLYIDYDNFDFADFDILTEDEINKRILEIIMNDLYQYKLLLD